MRQKPEPQIPRPLSGKSDDVDQDPLLADTGRCNEPMPLRFALAPVRAAQVRRRVRMTAYSESLVRESAD